MRLLAATLAFGLCAAPLSARADGLGCLLGPSQTNDCSLGGAPAVALAALAAPVIVAGAAVTAAHEMSRRTEERLPPGPHELPPNLSLVPESHDPYRAQANAPERPHKPSAAFQFNETATNVTTVVAGAMVAGAIIANIVKDAHGGGAHK
jgi:hypothetical protein